MIQISKKLLEQKYIKDKKTIKTIAYEIGCSFATIKRRLRKFKIVCPKHIKSFKYSRAFKLLRNTKTYKIKHSKMMKERWKDLEYRKHYKLVRQGWNPTAATRLKMSLAKKGKKIPDKQRRKMLKHNYSQNKMEKKFELLLNQICPKKYRFVGDGKIFINGFVPDFIHKTEKKLIEFFGDYWHNKTVERDRLRLKTYKKYGFKVLVVWQSDFQYNLKKTIRKINFFTNKEVI